MSRVNATNNLGILFPQIAAQWHPLLNKGLLPSKIMAGSNKKCWFLCEKGHEWQSPPSRRTLRNTECPYCTNRIVCVDNCLQTLYPEISLEWHPTKNEVLLPSDFVPGSHQRAWWRCTKGHEWETIIVKRTDGKQGCPYCSNYKACEDNCLQTLYPEIASQWHPTKNGQVSARDVTPGAYFKAWWVCSNLGHEYQAHTYTRTGLDKNGCPYCLFKTQEKVREIFQNLLNIPFPKFRPKFLKRMEYDGANEELKLAFEYDGEFHDKPHFNSSSPEASLEKTKERDAKKDRLSIENGWTLIRVHHSQKNNLEGYIFHELTKLNLINPMADLGPNKQESL